MMTATILGGLIIANILATRFIAWRGQYASSRVIASLVIWIVPVFGIIAALMVVIPKTPSAPPSAQDIILTDEFDIAVAPDSISVPEVQPAFSVVNHLMYDNGVPLLNWEAVKEWAQRFENEQQRQKALSQAQRAWLLHLRRALGDHFQFYKTADIWILSPLIPSACTAVARYVRSTRARLQERLPGLATFNDQQPNILIVMDNEETYYNYISTCYPAEGEFSFSGGMFIRHACSHLVITAAPFEHMEPVIAHEMTHESLSHLSLPRWLDEGIAVNTEHALTRAPYLGTTAAGRRREHREFWNPETIQEFWSGKSFFRADDGNKLSYDLARSLVQILASNWQAFIQFASTASREDSGYDAAQQVFGLDLGALVCTLMEQEPGASWLPTPQSWLANEAE